MLAEKRNAQPLPPVPDKYGVRLPLDRYCLTGQNFQIIPQKLSPKREIIPLKSVQKSKKIPNTTTVTTSTVSVSKTDSASSVSTITSSSPSSSIPTIKMESKPSTIPAIPSHLPSTISTAPIVMGLSSTTSKSINPKEDDDYDVDESEPIVEGDDENTATPNTSQDVEMSG